MTPSKPADIFLIAGGPQSKNNKAILAEVLKSSNTNLQSKVYRGGKEEATQAYCSYVEKPMTMPTKIAL